MYTAMTELQQNLNNVLKHDGNTVLIIDEQKLRTETIDHIISTAIFSPDEAIRKQARVAIRELAEGAGVYLTSIHNYYMAKGRGDVPNTFTVPAINIRTMTYDIACLILQLKKDQHIGPLIMEIARSEMGYTYQSYDDFAVAVLAAAIKVNYRGPVFLQSDHVQINAKRYQSDPQSEMNAMRILIKEALDAGFKNIDIDASTIVDLSKVNLDEQQKLNYTLTAELTAYIRELEPEIIPVSIGAEIGHIGGRNSTPEDFIAFMQGYTRLLKPGLPGISKMSIQTGTSHGGIPLADGTVAQVQVDFEAIKNIGALARDQYHIGGVVQHGASTLPSTMFHLFPQQQTLEIHLATGFQNIIYDHLPSNLRDRMYAWVTKERQSERKPEWDDNQFIYSTRKKAFGPFKRELWELSAREKEPIFEHLKQQLRFLFEELNVVDTQDSLEGYA